MSYWIQIELKPEGKSTGAMQLDLEKVERVQLKRDGSEIQAFIQYEGFEIRNPDGSISRMFGLDPFASAYFLKYWDKFVQFHEKAPQAKPGLVEVSRNGADAIKIASSLN